MEINVREKIRRGHYAYEINRPNQKDFTKYFVYKSGECLASGFIADILDSSYVEGWSYGSIQALERAGYTVEELFDKEAYKSSYNQFYIKEAVVHNRFKAEALEEVGLHTHPHANEIYNYVNELAHSEGLYEGRYKVLEILEELSYLIIV